MHCPICGHTLPGQVMWSVDPAQAAVAAPLTYTWYAFNAGAAVPIVHLDLVNAAAAAPMPPLIYSIR